MVDSIQKLVTKYQKSDSNPNRPAYFGANLNQTIFVVRSDFQLDDKIYSEALIAHATSIHPSIHPSIRPFIRPSIHPPILLPTRQLGLIILYELYFHFYYLNVDSSMVLNYFYIINYSLEAFCTFQIW